MNKTNGKIKVKSVEAQKKPIASVDNSTVNNNKNITAKKATAAFIGSYNYMQPGRSTQYDIGTDNYNGLTDIPVYIALMNEKNGGCLYFPTNLKQKYSYYRYFYRCFVDDSLRITLPNGTQKSIKDIQVGQNVLNINGQIVKVDKKIQNQYSGIVYQFKCQGKKPLKVTAQHPFYVLQKGKIWHRRIDVISDGKKVRRTQIVINYTPVWKKAEQLKQGDSFIVPNVFGDKKQISIQMARLIGYFASQGSFVKKKHKNVGLRFSFNSNQHILIQQTTNLLKCFSSNKVCKNVKDKSNCTTIYIADVKLTKIFEKYINGVALTKKFSNQIMNLSVQKTKHLLATYINGDGHITKQNQMQVTTVSQDLANQIYLLLAKCGYSPTRYQIKRELPQHDTNMIYIATHDSNDLSKYTNYKQNKYFCSSRYRKYNYKGNIILPIRKIIKSNYNGVVYNISTNGKEYQDRTFLIQNIATHNCDAYVGAAIDLHTDLPMSKLSLKMPPMANNKRRQYIKKKYQHMVQTLDLYTKLRDILFQFWLIGTCYCYLQYNPKVKQFDKLIILPPQDCNVTNYPFSNESVIAYNQQQIIQLVKRLKSLSSDYSGISAYLNDQIYTSSLSQMDKRILKNIPQQLLQHVFKNETILFDTDPYAGGEIGSFAFIVTRRKHSYATLGSSLLQRVFVPLMQKVHYTYTQWALASRNMTPRNKLTAPQINPDQLQELRQQFDQSMNMPQYAIVTNYDWNWQIIGADNRLIDLGRQYEVIQNQIFAGLGVTRQILSGQGMYSAGHINVQIMNARYLLVRDIFKKMVQDKIFKPIAQENGFYDVDQDGFKHYYYPKLSFERLSIVDNDQNFDKLFQLYQKGSLPIGYIYQILNIDEQQATQKLKQDLFTVKDSTFNEVIRESYSRMGDSLVQNSNLTELLADGLYVGGSKVKYTKQGEQEQSSDNPFDTNNVEENNEQNQNPFNVEENNEQNQNPFNVEENKQEEEQIENNLVQISDEQFEQFLKTQQLVAQDQDIKQFLKSENKYIVKNKDVKQFLNEYFLKPSNKDVDVFVGLIDNKLHPTNTMFENFLKTLNIVKPSNKDVQQFLKMFFLKPTNKQIQQFLKRYGKYEVTDQDVNEFIEQNKVKQENTETVTDQDIENFIQSQQGQNVDEQNINNFQLNNQMKFKL